MAIESTDFPLSSKTYVALKFQFTHSSHQLTYNLDLFLLLFVVCFLFIYLFRIQRKPFVQREGVHRALCPEPMMVMNYAKNEFKKNAIRRDHIWKQALRYNTTSLKF